MSNVLDQIKKLLALANNNSNVNEAANAAAQAQRLMAKHRIEVAELEAAGPAQSGGQQPDIAHETLTVEKSRIPWKNTLAGGLAYANGCRVYTTVKNGNSHTMYIGPRDGMQTIKYMYEYLVREVDRLAQLEKKRQLEERGYAVDRTFLTSFRVGAAMTISNRLCEEAKREEEVAQQTASSSALAVINRTQLAVNNVASQLKLRTLTMSVNDGDGFARGKAAGKTVNLNSGVPLGKGTSGELPR